MRGSPALAQRAWNSSGNGALFSKIIPNRTNALKQSPILSSFRLRRFPEAPQFHPGLPITSQLPSSSIQARVFSLSRVALEENRGISDRPNRPLSYKEELEKDGKESKEEAEDDSTGLDQEFQKSEKASQAAKVDLTARLSKDGQSGKQGGMGEIWRLIKIARPEAKTLVWALGFLIISSGVSMAVPFSIGKILDVATGQGEDRTLPFGLNMTTFYIGLGCVLACGAAANYMRIIILRIVGERIVARLRSRLYRKTFVQNAEFFDANRVGDLISRLGSDTIIVGKSITQNLSDGLRSVISGTAGFMMMGWVSMKLTGVLLLIAPPVGIIAFVAGKSLRDLSKKIQKNLGTLTKIAEERLGNVRTSQAFVGEMQEVARYNRQVKKIFELGKKEAMVAAGFYGSTGLMGNLTILAILSIGGGMVKSGSISIGELTSFLMYTVYAGSSMVGLSGFWGELMKGVGAASRLFELQDRNPTLSPTIGARVPSAKGDIKFTNVSFSYPTRPAVQIFKDLNFTVKEGTNVAVVAPSGAGKSTVASLLLRFYIPNTGTIEIDGKDITILNAKSLRRRIGYVGQEPVLFSGTVAENISYGMPHATRAQIVSAARRANCQFISDFPDGLETHVGARGTQLSGGQKQRIAIARALIKEPDILILDEATSALDAESETLVNQALTRLLQGHNTTISIAHRLSTIQRSDRIICLGSDGQVAEEGTYKELSANKDGAFSKLMEWQITGGDPPPSHRSSSEFDPTPTEEEEIEAGLIEVEDHTEEWSEEEKKAIGDRKR